MNVYQTSKKIRYTLAVVYIIMMGIILTGTYLSQPPTIEQPPIILE